MIFYAFLVNFLFFSFIASPVCLSWGKNDFFLGDNKNMQSSVELYLLAKKYFNTGHYKQALLYVDKSLYKNKNDYHVLFLKGKLLSVTQHYKNAIPYFKKSFSLNQDCSDCLFEIGKSYFNLKQHHKAKKNFEKNLKLFPEHESSMFFLAYIQQLDLHLDESRQMYEEILKIYPDNLDAEINLTKVLYLQGEEDLAKEKLLSMLKKFPKEGIIDYNLGFLEQNKKSWNKSQAYYEQAESKKHITPELYNNLGVVLYKRKKTERAIFYFKKSISQNNSFSDAYFNLSLLYKKSKKFDKSQYYLEKIISLNPNFTEAQDLLMEIYFQMGKTRESLALFNKFFLNKKITDKYIFYAAYNHWKSHDNEKSIYYLNKIKEIKDINPLFMLDCLQLALLMKKENLFMDLFYHTDSVYREDYDWRIKVANLLGRTNNKEISSNVLKFWMKEVKDERMWLLAMHIAREMHEEHLFKSFSENALSHFNNSASLALEMGYFYRDMNQLDAEVYWFDRAKSSEEDHYLSSENTLKQAEIEWNYALFRSGNTTKSIGNLKAISMKEPDNAWSFYYLGTIYYKKGKHKEAKKFLDKSLALNNNNALFYIQRAQAKMALNQLESAQHDFSQALAVERRFFVESDMLVENDN
jgi:tetratricopeptide (TPR) repeat protein